jgi:2-phospho-L-lactate guanylyltransferase
VTDAVDEIAASGIDRVVVAHADLPLATDLSVVVGIDGVTLVPDRRDDGTNVASIPTAAGFVFSYGPGSFRRHITEAERIGLPVHVVRDHALGWDIDHPDDLTNLSWTFPANPR